MMKETSFTLKKEGRVYLDHNATTPVAQAVVDRLKTWAEEWGNPSSIHQTGRGPKNLIRQARKSFAQRVGCHDLEVVFTSGGSESNNLALKSVFAARERHQKNHYMVSAVEHPSVMKTAEELKRWGAKVSLIPVDRNGQLDLDEYQKKLAEEDTALVSVMLANNETGNIFPIKEMVELAHKYGALFHCDAVQSLGKLDINVRDLDVDYASFSAHKFYALKGCGVLYVKKSAPFHAQIQGGGQERRRRAGTENTLAIASLGLMSEQSHYQEHYKKLETLRDTMEKRILDEIEGVEVTGGQGSRLPNTSSLLLQGVDGESLLMNLDIEGFSVSTGAACSSGNPEPSPVLLAMGLTVKEAQSSLRLSLGWGNTESEVNRFVDTLKVVVERLRSLNTESEMPLRGEK